MGLPHIRSLASYLILILTTGLLTVQVASFGLVHWWQSEDTKNRMLRFMALDTVLVARIMDTLPPERRAGWIDTVNRGFYPITLGRDPPHAADVPRGLVPTFDQIADIAAARLGRPGVRWTFRDDGPEMVVPLSGAQALFFSGRDPLPGPSAGALAAYLLALFAALSLVAWMAVRIAMRPLNRFAAAAAALGRDISIAPLPPGSLYEVRQIATTLNAMQARILRQIDERTQILAAITHDLQTPVTRMRLRAETVTDEALRLRMISDLDGMAELIHESIHYARSAQLQEGRVTMDLQQLVESLVNEMSDVGMKVSFEGMLHRPYYGAIRAVQRALQNLVSNAIRYGGEASILLSENIRESCIRVTDPGPGIPDELLETVFEPFFRVSGERNFERGGVGLGLAIARNLIRAHGGDISLRNRPGGGCEATMVLPHGQALPPPRG
jgi:protein-histidine pros-kinase